MRSRTRLYCSRVGKQQFSCLTRHTRYFPPFILTAPTKLFGRPPPSLHKLPRWSYISQPVRHVTSAEKARDLNQQGIDDQVSAFDEALKQEKDNQHRTPWHREGAQEPPVRRQRSASAMTKGD